MFTTACFIDECLLMGTVSGRTGLGSSTQFVKRSSMSYGHWTWEVGHGRRPQGKEEVGSEEAEVEHVDL